MTPEQAAATFARDRACVLWLMDPTHECADRFGHPHAADDLRRMTIEHVKEHSATGVRGKWLVTMCGMGNVSVPSRVQREWIRDYYRRVEG